MHIFVPNCLVIHLSPKPKLRQEHLYSYQLVRNFVHIDAYQCKTLLILVESSNTKHLLCIHPQPIEYVVETTLRRCFDRFPRISPTRSSMRNYESESNRARKNFVRARKILKLRAQRAHAARGLMLIPVISVYIDYVNNLRQHYKIRYLRSGNILTFMYELLWFSNS